MLGSLALLAALAQTPAGTIGTPGTSGTSGTPDVIRVDVIARDPQGRPVETLTAADFALREDGMPQTLTGVELVRGKPRLIGIYLDEYYVGAPKTAAVRAALHRLVDTGLAAGDQVVILRPLDSLLRITLTSDRATLHRAIDAFEGRRGDYEPRTDFERSLVAGDRARADVQRAQSTWSTLNALTLHLANRASALPGRSTLLYVSEQADPIPRRRGFEALPTSSSVTRVANRSNVSIYVFDPRDAAERDATPEEGPNLLKGMTEETDGALIGDETADAGLKRMLDDTASYYLLSYRSARGRDGLFHALDVTSKRPKVTLRFRKGFQAPTPEDMDRAKFLATSGVMTALPPIKLEPPRRASTLIRPWFGIARGDNGKIRMTFVWEPSGAVPGDRRVRTPVRLDVKAVGSDGKTAFEGEVSDRASAVFDVPPGRMTLTSTVEDSAAQRIDSDIRDVIVRDLRGAVVLGTPQVFRGRTARDMRELREDAAAIPIAAREFSRTEQLMIRVPAYSAQAPELSAALVSPSKQIMRQLAVAPGTVGEINIPLAGLAPGNYSVEISAKSSAGAAKETVAFRIAN